MKIFSIIKKEDGVVLITSMLMIKLNSIGTLYGNKAKRTTEVVFTPRSTFQYGMFVDDGSGNEATTCPTCEDADKAPTDLNGDPVTFDDMDRVDPDPLDVDTLIADANIAGYNNDNIAEISGNEIHLGSGYSVTLTTGDYYLLASILAMAALLMLIIPGEKLIYIWRIHRATRLRLNQ